MLTPSISQLEFVIIDAQNSFCHPEKGALYVPGAEKDMERLAALIERLFDKIDVIDATLDSHHELDVAHPVFWINSKGEHPEPFTIISKEDVVKGVWKPFDPDMPSSPYGTLWDRMIHYVTELEKGGRYQLTIWPPHCRIGSPGHNLFKPIREILQVWERHRYREVNYIIKGSNIFTENYSGVQADVPDPDDPSTQMNTGLIQKLENAEKVVIGGEAASHCVANTVRDLVRNFNEETIKKCVLLEDAMSPVQGFEEVADEFFQEMNAKGMHVTTTTDFSV